MLNVANNPIVLSVIRLSVEAPSAEVSAFEKHPSLSDSKDFYKICSRFCWIISLQKISFMMSEKSINRFTILNIGENWSLFSKLLRSHSPLYSLYTYETA